MDKNKKLLGTMITIGVIYIISSILYFFSSLGLEKSINSDMTKNFLITTFVPVVVLIFAPFLIRSYYSMKGNIITQEKFKKRVTIMFVLFIIAIIMGFFYFRDNQKDIIRKQKNALNNIVSNNVIEESDLNNIEEKNTKNITNNAINNTKNNLTNNVEGNVLNNAI